MRSHKALSAAFLAGAMMMLAGPSASAPGARSDAAKDDQRAGWNHDSRTDAGHRGFQQEPTWIPVHRNA